jgi:hypothetical protein
MGPYIIVTYDVYKNNYVAARQRGSKIRLITEIIKDNLQYYKELLNIVSENDRRKLRPKLVPSMDVLWACYPYSGTKNYVKFGSQPTGPITKSVLNQGFYI